MSSKAESIRLEILRLVGEYHAEAFPHKEFAPGVSSVPCAGRVFDEREIKLAVDASLEFWLTLGRFGHDFEKRFAQFFGLRFATLVNSGSSANLLALTALTSESLGDDRLNPGDEVITVAAGFPTTVNPIVQNRLVPVFVDVELGTYNIDISKMENALSPKTGAVMIAHTLGNPFDAEAVTAFAQKHNLWLIEDCCDAVGAKVGGKLVGTFGDLSTVSFFPAHHITMGEGGCVLTSDAHLRKLVESFRDWGRDCWCATGKDNTCGKRFAWQLGELPEGFDHKYTYSHIGYNLKPTDWQAAIGLAQLDKLPEFIEARKSNFQFILDGLSDLTDYFILPKAQSNSEPSWFGFPLAVRPNAPFTRAQVIDYLESRKIATRLLFGGNLTRQPAYKNVQYRVSGSLDNSDFVMNNVFWVGVYPGLSEDALRFMVETIHQFVSLKLTDELPTANRIPAAVSSECSSC